MQEKKAPAEAVASQIDPLVNPVFISDLHLSPEHPRTMMQFFRFMKAQVPFYSEVVVLGDLFDYWLGDDDMERADAVIKAFAYATSIGKRIIIAHGNRDFLLGEDFAKATGATLIAPGTAVDCMDWKLLLSHGDEWCTKDTEYQDFRRMTRDPAWQLSVLSIPREKRAGLALQARSRSQDDNSKKASEIMDVSDIDVYKAAKATGADIVIHGHTHRPARHEMAEIQRWVIPNWDLDNGSCWGYIRIVNKSRLQIIM